LSPASIQPDPARHEYLWSALPDVRPWRPGAGLLGFAWVDGGRDGATSQKLEEPPPETGTGSSAALGRRLD
jgi:hypothetical protein